MFCAALRLDLPNRPEATAAHWRRDADAIPGTRGACGTLSLLTCGGRAAYGEPDQRFAEDHAPVYLRPPGYGEMFAELGFSELVERARSGARDSSLRL